jgi:hypothetical protein
MGDNNSLSLQRKQQQQQQLDETTNDGRKMNQFRSRRSTASMRLCWFLLFALTAKLTSNAGGIDAFILPQLHPARNSLSMDGTVGRRKDHHASRCVLAATSGAARNTVISSIRDHFDDHKQQQNSRTMTNDDHVYCPSHDSSSSDGGLQDDINGRKSLRRPPPVTRMQRTSWLATVMESFKRTGPPPEVEDTSVLLYDVFLLINLTASISLWVVHRMDVSFMAPAISEGCLLSVLWIASGLYSGAFLYSAVDGHRPDGGPPAASMLAVNTFINTINLRLLFALASAVLEHRPVGTGVGEDLLSLEMGFGLVLMTVWRALHSRFVTRL